jgi:hypothetical protein
MEILVLGLVIALIGATWLFLALVDALERKR